MQRIESHFVLCLALLGLGCSAAPPTGPAFEPLPPPAGGEALVYVYRLDALRGVGPIEVSLDGGDIGRLRSGEYLPLRLAAGSHELGIELRALGWLPRSWNRLSFEVERGATVHLKTWAGYREIVDEGPARHDAPGRSNRHASVSVFAALRSAEEALPELEACVLAPAGEDDVSGNGRSNENVVSDQ